MRHQETWDDTIAAVATAVGSCGIGVIRISGPESFEVASRVFRGKSDAKVSEYASHTIHYGSCVDPKSGETIDQVLLSVFKSPSSYTGEDVAEISCHGGTVTMRKVLDAVFAAGARHAEPGEFTKRAFLNGRLDLAQAEAVNDIIHARTEDAQRLAMRQLGGLLSTEVSALIQEILAILAKIEAAVDFPEDVEEPDYSALAIDIKAIENRINNLISTSNRGRIYREGISLAIVGRPNVGKSSLLNALLRESRAIVTSVPGTTRDVIEEVINIRGIPVVAADTAGLRDASDEVEKIGIELAERAMSAASLVLAVVDARIGLTEDDRAILNKVSNAKLIVLNKIDLLPSEELGHVMKSIADEAPNTVIVPVSAADRSGIDQLEDEIAEAVLGGAIEVGEGAFVTNARHRQSLVDARESLMRSIETINSGLPIDFLSVDLLAARMSLGDITGDTASEDLIDRIFADFCIGK